MQILSVNCTELFILHGIYPFFAMCVQKNGTAVRLSESSNFVMYIMISEIIACAAAFNLYIHVLLNMQGLGRGNFRC